ncbi:heat-inducible transcriptional repressor HrcA [Virgibacillus sp. W0430]|uniref:heat-inducible transcriptional repressor HrcA n=1 Tax=Virgibacillus sp. W0430 TaxID=3391580 RepID=UPI003F4771F0
MLTDRQLLILQTIIDDFIESAHPVGSRLISKKENITLSAATIRNVMADLEDMELLEKTHSSSGRIPSEKGYRYYVDHVIAPSIQLQEVDVIKHMLQDGFFAFEQIVQMSAQVLSDLTNYTSIILGPEVNETKLKQIQIVPLSDQTAVAILVTNTGHVEHRSFTIPEGISTSDLEKMVNILNERLHAVPITHLSDRLDAEIHFLMKKYIKNSEQLFRYLKTVLSHDESVKLYIGGKSNMLMQPEFQDVDKVHSFYSMMENEEAIVNLLKNNDKGLRVSIGNENKIEAIKNLSLITANYQLGSEQVGTIGLIGPTRMEYRKVITLLHALSEEMTDALYVWYQNNQ